MLPVGPPIERKAGQRLDFRLKNSQGASKRRTTIDLWKTDRTMQDQSPSTNQRTTNSTSISFQVLIVKDNNVKCHIPKLQTSLLRLLLYVSRKKRNKFNFGWIKILKMKYNISVSKGQ